MAETTSPVKFEAPTETEQELIISGKESLENYIQKGSDAGTFDASLPPLEIPIIDFGLLTSPSSSSQELEKLRSALCSWGCFQAINHGVEPALLNKVREATKQFFALPLAEKKKYYQEDGSFEGYGNDKMQTLHWSHLLYLTVHPEDKRQLKFWPENPEYFRETLDEFSKQSEVINQIILKAFARSLNMEENCFLDMFGEQALMLARFNWYPPCPRPDLVLGVFPHTDGSGLTVLLPDKEVGGLQFLKDNQWYSVPVIPEAFVVNVGDQLEIISNGIFKSPVHRVVTNSERERISLAMFYCPNQEKEIEPANWLVNESRPRLYKTVKNYNRLYLEQHKLGKRPIEAALL